jgi:hypothetical protein
MTNFLKSRDGIDLSSPVIFTQLARYFDMCVLWCKPRHWTQDYFCPTGHTSDDATTVTGGSQNSNERAAQMVEGMIHKLVPDTVWSELGDQS